MLGIETEGATGLELMESLAVERRGVEELFMEQHGRPPKEEEPGIVRKLI